jgi:hypothetical protein
MDVRCSISDRSNNFSASTSRFALGQILRVQLEWYSGRRVKLTTLLQLMPKSTLPLYAFMEWCFCTGKLYLSPLSRLDGFNNTNNYITPRITFGHEDIYH